jgi:hypothetical protein
MTSWPGYPPPAPPKQPKPWYRNVWTWVIAYIVVVGLGCVGLVVAFAFFAGEPEGPDSYWVDQDSVNRAVTKPCDEMSTAAAQIQIFSTPAVGSASLHHFAEVGRGIPNAIESVDDTDSDSLQWRDDWNVLLDAVDAYADKLESDGQKTFATPKDEDGYPVIQRMSAVSDVGCDVPPIIEALDPRFEPYY